MTLTCCDTHRNVGTVVSGQGRTARRCPPLLEGMWSRSCSGAYSRQGPGAAEGRAGHSSGRGAVQVNSSFHTHRLSPWAVGQPWAQDSQSRTNRSAQKSVHQLSRLPHSPPLNQPGLGMRAERGQEDWFCLTRMHVH